MKGKKRGRSAHVDTTNVATQVDVECQYCTIMRSQIEQNRLELSALQKQLQQKEAEIKKADEVKLRIQEQAQKLELKI